MFHRLVVLICKESVEMPHPRRETFRGTGLPTLSLLSILCFQIEQILPCHPSLPVWLSLQRISKGPFEINRYENLSGSSPMLDLLFFQKFFHFAAQVALPGHLQRHIQSKTKVDAPRNTSGDNPFPQLLQVGRRTEASIRFRFRRPLRLNF